MDVDEGIAPQDTSPEAFVHLRKVPKSRLLANGPKKYLARPLGLHYMYTHFVSPSVLPTSCYYLVKMFLNHMVYSYNNLHTYACQHWHANPPIFDKYGFAEQ